MQKYKRRRYLHNFSLTAEQNALARIDHDAAEEHLARRRNDYLDVTGKGKNSPTPGTTYTPIGNTQAQPGTPKPVKAPLTTEQIERNFKAAVKVVKLLAIGAAVTVAASAVILVAGKVVNTYNETAEWIHKKIDPDWVKKEDVAPKPVTAINKPVETAKKTAPPVTKPAQPVEKAPPPPVSVYRQMPQGTTLLPSSDYLSDATNDALVYFRQQSGSKISKTQLLDFAKDSAKGIDRTFTQGMIDSNGETLEVIMGTFNGVGRHAVVCLGSKEGIRSVTHMYTGATPENLEVSFSNNVMSSTGQNINLTEIANRASQCHQVTGALQKIDPKIRFVLN